MALSNEDAVKMIKQLAEHMTLRHEYCLTHCTAVLFGTPSQRDRAGLGDIKHRWRGLNRGEQAGVIQQLVWLDLMFETSAPNSMRPVYQLDATSMSAMRMLEERNNESKGNDNV